MSASVEQIERPLMTPDEVMRLKPPKKSGSGTSERIAAPGDMLIFVSGHHPIHGTQILYFSDPILANRAAIPPPTEFAAIEDGRVNSQRAADRTANVISKPEILAEPVSTMERAFVQALSGRVAPRAASQTRRTPKHGFLERLSFEDREE
jgi:type IV secretion system protein VirD4